VRGQRRDHQYQRLGQGARHARQPGRVRGQLDDPRDRGVEAQRGEVLPDRGDGPVQQPRRGVIGGRAGYGQAGSPIGTSSAPTCSTRASGSGAAAK